jgi:hypothetical protein
MPDDRLLETEVECRLNNVGFPLPYDGVERPSQSRSFGGFGPCPQPSANPNRAMHLNLEYQANREHWEALPWWKLLLTKRPERPTGI